MYFWYDTYMSWASKRQTKYFVIFIIIFIVSIVFIFYPILTKKPQCDDGKQNGQETGVDCGGSCTKVCLASVASPVILWSRAFPVTNTVYNLVAYVENQNKDSAVREAHYEFRIYDSNNLLIARREGVTYIPPNKQFAIFESRFDAGKSDIRSVRFELDDNLSWVRQSPSLDLLPFHVDQLILDDSSVTPTLSARLNNDSIYDMPEFDAIAILYDENHNVVNVSRTQKDGLSSGRNMPLYFTWPKIFDREVVSKEVLIQINPFNLNF